VINKHLSVRNILYVLETFITIVFFLAVTAIIIHGIKEDIIRNLSILPEIFLGLLSYPMLIMLAILSYTNYSLDSKKE
jgi:hypothetical protein